MKGIARVQCPACKKVLSTRVSDASEGMLLSQADPCHECLTHFEDWRKHGHVIFIVRDEYEKSVDMPEKPSAWDYFSHAHLLPSEFARSVFFEDELKENYHFVTLSRAKRIGIETISDFS